MTKVRRVDKESTHLRWNWEQSPENSKLVRYHFIAVDNRGRQKKSIDAALDLFNKYNTSFEPVRENKTGREKDSDYSYCFWSYDCPTTAFSLHIDLLKFNVIRDLRIRDRKNPEWLENFVADLYYK